ncbi:nitrogenase component 1 [Clostridium sp. LP20]|uniref:nitrogenase component 1 n=1 Tax=Clostridium sp. LP20 TaxID=3418665 RepID=UPI003EE477DD
MAAKGGNLRNSCAFHGALQTVKEIAGVVPIVHSTAGCTIQGTYGDELNTISNFHISSSNIIEKQVIFGGTSRLREQIKNTIKVIDGDLYIVLSGCTSELVGDDIIAMTREAKEEGKKIIYCKTPGFKGNVYKGYEDVVSSIINQLPEVFVLERKRDERLVNVFGIMPNENPFWRGNLQELKRILEGIGLKLNILFGPEGSVDSWRNVPVAALNIVVSSYGKKAAEDLNNKYNTPFVIFDNIPIGANETRIFLNRIVELTNTNKEKAKLFIDKEEGLESYYLERLLDSYIKYNFQRNIALVGSESTVIGLTKYLYMYFGLIPKVVIITDKRSGEYGIFSNEYRFTELYFTEAEGEIKKILENTNIDLILGSSIEEMIALDLGIPFQIISSPNFNRIILDKGILGFKGGLNLLEDIANTILKLEEEKDCKSYKNIKRLLGVK